MVRHGRRRGLAGSPTRSPTLSKSPSPTKLEKANGAPAEASRSVLPPPLLPSCSPALSPLPLSAHCRVLLLTALCVRLSR